MNEEVQPKTLKSIRQEMENLDTQIKSANVLKEILEEERKPLHSIYKWESPERVYEQKDKKWYLIVSTVSMFLIVLSLLTDNYGLVVAIIALIVLLYALNSVKPGLISHELTNKGVSINSKLYTWKKIDRFWVSKRGENRFLNVLVDVKEKEQEQIISFLGEADVKKVVSYMTRFVDYVAEDEINNNYINRKLFGETEPLSSFMEK